jgi:hypothetical protein
MFRHILFSWIRLWHSRAPGKECKDPNIQTIKKLILVLPPSKVHWALGMSKSTALVRSWRMDAIGAQHKFSVWNSCLAIPILIKSKHKLSNPDRMRGFQCMNICFEDLLVDFGNSKNKTITTREQQTRFLPNESLYVFNRTICACVTGPTRGHEWTL